MGLKLYSTIGSPAVRSTLLTIRAIGLTDKVEIINVDLTRLEQLKPEFLQNNPLHTVPVLEDGEFVVWDSHAINAYLVTKYAEHDSLCPKDPQKRALIDSMNHFDTGYLFANGVKIIKAVFLWDKSADFNKLKEDVLGTYDYLELILAQRRFVAGEEMTIADFNIVATLSTIEVYLPLNNDKHKNIIRWYNQIKQLPYYAINQKGVDVFSAYFSHLLAKL